MWWRSPLGEVDQLDGGSPALLLIGLGAQRMVLGPVLLPSLTQNLTGAQPRLMYQNISFPPS